MKRNLSSVSKKNKKQRGVAVIFTLGILGLLTVMALGFASTALLNNSLSKNVMNNAYARSLAKNLALTQALYIISQKEIDSNGGLVDYRNIYSWGTDTNKDFLWKLDYAEAGVPGVQIYKYEPDQNTSDKPRYNPANNVRWQYVKDTSATPKIIGRYAYVVVPDKGSVDPSVNIGRDDDVSNTTIKNLESRIPLGITVNNLADAYNSTPTKFRWMSYMEIIKKSAVSDASYSDWFQYNGIRPSLTMKTPEAFWKNGKLYSRFNMNRTDWDSKTPESLCGEGKTSADLAEFPNEQTFIPWLNDMYNNTSTQKQALQIAANIIQYNRNQDADTVSDKSAEADWLTDTPSYAGIGRHPMLNEIGFLVRARTVVVPDLEHATVTESQKTITYTPKYYITLDAGAELIYPFGKAEYMQDSEISFSGDIEIQLSKFKKEVLDLSSSPITDGVVPEDTLHSDIANVKIDLKSGAVSDTTPSGSPSTSWIQETGSGYTEGWLNNKGFTLTVGGGDWNASPAYSKAGAFWIENKSGQRTLIVTIRSVTVTTNRSQGNDGDISAAMAKRLRVNWVKFTPKNVVLKYGGKQRDAVSQLQSSALELSSQQLKEERVWFAAYQAADPLVNLNSGDWTCSSKATVWDDSTSLTNDYPGTCKGPEGSETHINQPFKAILEAAATDPVKVLLTSYGYDSTDGDPAYVAGTSRLPTSFIRHGQMLSFWELGCISRGKKFENLNLETKAGSSPDFSRSSGDAGLFDQLKFTDENYTDGKININTDVHKVLEQLFLYSGTAGKKMTFKKDIFTSSGNDLLAAGTDDTTSVKIQSQTLEQFKNGTAHTGDCLACKLAAITQSYQFQNRADLLLASKDDLPNISDANKNPIASATKPIDDVWTELRSLLLQGTTCLEKIQLVSKLMPIMRTAPVDTLRVVIVAQSIRDIGGNIPVLIDWDGTGLDAAVSNTAKAMFKAGYRRTIDGAAISGLSEPTLTKTYTSNTIGTYDFGSDKITGETRLVATLVRDPVKRKWKLVRVQYVD